jgi:hypothetical protein
VRACLVLYLCVRFVNSESDDLHELADELFRQADGYMLLIGRDYGTYHGNRFLSACGITAQRGFVQRRSESAVL